MHPQCMCMCMCPQCMCMCMCPQWARVANPRDDHDARRDDLVNLTHERPVGKVGPACRTQTASKVLISASSSLAGARGHCIRGESGLVEAHGVRSRSERNRWTS